MIYRLTLAALTGAAILGIYAVHLAIEEALRTGVIP